MVATDWRAQGFFVWRMLATGFCFACFSLGGLLLSLTLLPATALCVRDPGRRKRRLQRIIHHSFRFFIWLMCASRVLVLTVEDPARFTGIRNRLVIANHPTLIDVVILIALIPELDCVVKQDLWRNRFLRRVVQYCGYISNSDPSVLLDQCVERLRSGASLVVFPEGTRTRPQQPLQFQRGVANIAVRAGIPIIPVYIDYQGSGLGKGDPWYRIPRHGSVHIRVRCGAEIATVTDPAVAPSVAARHLNDYLLQHYRQALAETPVSAG